MKCSAGSNLFGDTGSGDKKTKSRTNRRQEKNLCESIDTEEWGEDCKDYSPVLELIQILFHWELMQKLAKYRTQMLTANIASTAPLYILGLMAALGAATVNILI